MTTVSLSLRLEVYFFLTVIVMLYRCVYMIEGYSIACKQCCTSIQPYYITYQWYNSSKFSGYIDNQQWVLLFFISSRTRKSDYFPEGVYLCYRLVTKSKPARANLQVSTILLSQQFAVFSFSFSYIFLGYYLTEKKIVIRLYCPLYRKHSPLGPFTLALDILL